RRACGPAYHVSARPFARRCGVTLSSCEQRQFAVMRAISLGLITASAAFLLSGCTVSNPYADARAQAYVDKTIPAEFGHWSPRAVAPQVSKQAHDHTPPQQVASLFRLQNHRLGSIRSYGGSTGAMRSFLIVGQGFVEMGRYKSRVAYSRGDA